jgi:predicted small lipoprotein YifL
MVPIVSILVSRIALAASAATFALLLVGCGQKGPLFLPTEPAAANRATLPETLLPGALTPAASDATKRATP